jgi:hypothetical protein
MNSEWRIANNELIYGFPLPTARCETAKKLRFAALPFVIRYSLFAILPGPSLALRAPIGGVHP